MPGICPSTARSDAERTRCPFGYVDPLRVGEALSLVAKSLYDKLLAYIHGHSRVFVDETRMPVLKRGRKRTKVCQFWAHAVDDRPWNGPAHPAVAYVFAQGRGKAEIQSQLVRYQGLLQVDAYKAYKSLTRSGRKAGTITLAYCPGSCPSQVRRCLQEVQVGTGQDGDRAPRGNLCDRKQDSRHKRRTSAISSPGDNQRPDGWSQDAADGCAQGDIRQGSGGLRDQVHSWTLVWADALPG